MKTEALVLIQLPYVGHVYMVLLSILQPLVSAGKYDLIVVVKLPTSAICVCGVYS